MKTLALPVLALLMTFQGYSYTWTSLGPDTINASRLCFNVGLPYWAICADDGMYLFNYSTNDCEFCTYGYLPVVGTCYLDPDQMLVAMGNGSWSDGIYRFNWETHTFEIVMWAAYPNFLEYHDPTGTYWLGTQFGGMFVSENGLEWTAVPFFEGKSCTCFDYYDERMVVSELGNLYSIYCSDDNGNTWYQAAFPLMISDMKFDSWGKLWGIFPDYSNSSGLWFSDDYGNEWQVEFWSDNMSTVGLDAFGNLFVGWEEELGIAYYDPLAPPPGLTYLNKGLPSLSINNIQLNPVMSAPALFICTDSGAYYSYDYMVGDKELFVPDLSLSIYPNPSRENITVICSQAIGELILLTQSGETVYIARPGLSKTIIHADLIPSGVYIVQCQTHSGIKREKIVIL